MIIEVGQKHDQLAVIDPFLMCGMSKATVEYFAGKNAKVPMTIGLQMCHASTCMSQRSRCWRQPTWLATLLLNKKQLFDIHEKQ